MTSGKNLSRSFNFALVEIHQESKLAHTHFSNLVTKICLYVCCPSTSSKFVSPSITTTLKFTRNMLNSIKRHLMGKAEVTNYLELLSFKSKVGEVCFFTVIFCLKELANLVPLPAVHWHSNRS